MNDTIAQPPERVPVNGIKPFCNISVLGEHPSRLLREIRDRRGDHPPHIDIVNDIRLRNVSTLDALGKLKRHIEHVLETIFSRQHEYITTPSR